MAQTVAINAFWVKAVKHGTSGFAIRVLYRPPNERYTNTSPYTSRFSLPYTSTETKVRLAVYGSWFALIVDIDDCEGEFYPETRMPTYQEIRAWVKQNYGFNVNSTSISQTKKKYGLIPDRGDVQGRYVKKVRLEKEAAIREALVSFGLLENEWR